MPARTNAAPKQSIRNVVKASPTRTVLIAVAGLSPAVLMETVWALAKHPTHPVIPDVVIVLTTLTGECRMKEQLFGADELWLTLRRQLLGKKHETDARLDFADTPDRIRIFTRKTGGRRVQLDRMDTLEETEAVGDCLVEEIWNWVGRPDTRVFASISGGFKTMSALMYAAMSVLGGQADRILHVLVEEPFDGGTSPLFFWPEQPSQHLVSTRPSKAGPAGTSLKAKSVVPILTDVQFPALRKLFHDYGFNKAPTFSALVEKCREAVDSIAPVPIQSCEIRRSAMEVRVDGVPVNVSKMQFYLLLFLAECVREGQEFDNAKDINEAFLEFLIHEKNQAPAPRRAFLEQSMQVVREEVRTSSEPRFTKNLSALRKTLGERREPVCIALAKALPSGKNRLLLGREQIAILD